MKIYLAGSVPKGDKESDIFDDWRLRYKKTLSTLFDAQFIDPYHRELDESDSMEVVGQDCMHIQDSDLVVMNSEERLGAGTASEMVIAKYFKKPLIIVLPKDTHHRRSNIVFNGKNIDDWIHPFIFTLADFVIEKIEDIKNIKDQIFTKPIKDIEVIDEAIKYYKEKINP